MSSGRLVAYIFVAGWIGSESSAQWSSFLAARWGWFVFDTCAIVALVILLGIMTGKDSRRGWIKD